LQNRIYLGEVTHRGQVYAGEHNAIITREVWDKVQAQLKTNNQARRNGITSSNPSLLVGLIYDDQRNRFTPSHAVKNGKRYRYYVSQAIIKDKKAGDGKPGRIPAHEIENLILSELASFLGSSHAVLQALSSPSEKPAVNKTLISASKRELISLKLAPPAQAREFLRTVIARIVVNDTHVELLVNKQSMREVLIGSTSEAKHGANGYLNNKIGPKDFLKLLVQARFKQCGGEVRLVVSPDSAEDAPNRTVPSLMKAIARAHEWRERLLKGEVSGRRSIAKMTGLDERYVARILDCAFLAPDIVDKILNGHQSADLTLDKLRSRLPLGWPEQRQRLGMMSAPMVSR
jgi:hypothetical protein